MPPSPSSPGPRLPVLPAAGTTIAESHQAVATFRTDGTIDDYDAAALARIASALAAAVGVSPERVTVAVNAGSVLLEVTVDAADSTSSDAISAALSSLLASTEEASALLNVRMLPGFTVRSITREVATGAAAAAPSAATSMGGVAIDILLIAALGTVTTFAAIGVGARRRRHRPAVRRTSRVAVCGPCSLPLHPEMHRAALTFVGLGTPADASVETPPCRASVISAAFRTPEAARAIDRTPGLPIESATAVVARARRAREVRRAPASERRDVDHSFACGKSSDATEGPAAKALGGGGDVMACCRADRASQRQEDCQSSFKSTGTERAEAVEETEYAEGMTRFEEDTASETSSETLRRARGRRRGRARGAWAKPSRRLALEGGVAQEKAADELSEQALATRFDPSNPFSGLHAHNLLGASPHSPTSHRRQMELMSTMLGELARMQIQIQAAQP